MRMKQCGVAFILLFGLAASPQNTPPPQHNRVPDSATAVSIARAVAIKVYGKRKIEYEEPLGASLKDGVWNVAGTLCCPDHDGKRVCEPGRCLGGVVEVRIRQSGRKNSLHHSYEIAAKAHFPQRAPPAILRGRSDSAHCCRRASRRQFSVSRLNPCSRIQSAGLMSQAVRSRNMFCRRFSIVTSSQLEI
jgi:hypothetical protein